jgi:hypothetical protein
MYKLGGNMKSVISTIKPEQANYLHRTFAVNPHEFLNALDSLAVPAWDAPSSFCAVTAWINTSTAPAVVIDDAVCNWLPGKLAFMETLLVSDSPIVQSFVRRLAADIFNGVRLIADCQKLPRSRSILLQALGARIMGITIAHDDGLWQDLKTLLVQQNLAATPFW